MDDEVSTSLKIYILVYALIIIAALGYFVINQNQLFNEGFYSTNSIMEESVNK